MAFKASSGLGFRVGRYYGAEDECSGLLDDVFCQVLDLTVGHAIQET